MLLLDAGFLEVRAVVGMAVVPGSVASEILASKTRDGYSSDPNRTALRTTSVSLEASSSQSLCSFTHGCPSIRKVLTGLGDKGGPVQLWLTLLHRKGSSA